MTLKYKLNATILMIIFNIHSKLYTTNETENYIIRISTKHSPNIQQKIIKIIMFNLLLGNSPLILIFGKYLF